MTGDLTFMGVTKPVTLDVTFNGSFKEHPMSKKAALGFSAHGQGEAVCLWSWTRLVPFVGDDVTVAARSRVPEAVSASPAMAVRDARSRGRYTLVAITFHWTIALLMVGMVGSGWWMTGAIRDPARQALAYDVYQLHKAFGLCVLALTLGRLAWRLTHRRLRCRMGSRPSSASAPMLCTSSLYVLTLAVPLLGWAMVSASPLGIPTVPVRIVRGGHICRSYRTAPIRLPSRASSSWGHEVARLFGRGCSIVLHVAAALKHHFVDRDGVLGRMLPLGYRRSHPSARSEHP